MERALTRPPRRVNHQSLWPRNQLPARHVSKRSQRPQLDPIRRGAMSCPTPSGRRCASSVTVPPRPWLVSSSSPSDSDVTAISLFDAGHKRSAGTVDRHVVESEDVRVQPLTRAGLVFGSEPDREVVANVPAGIQCPEPDPANVLRLRDTRKSRYRQRRKYGRRNLVNIGVMLSSRFFRPDQIGTGQPDVIKTAR